VSLSSELIEAHDAIEVIRKLESRRLLPD